MIIEKKAVIFDLDGTLLDSAPDLISALNHVLTQDGRPLATLDETRSMVGGGAELLIRRAFDADKENIGDARITALVHEFISYYADHLTTQSCLYPDAVSILDHLQARDYLIGLCTNKPHHFTEEILENLGIASYFSAVTGYHLGGVRKPDPAHLGQTLDALSIHASHALMVGDSISDKDAAQGHDMKMVFARYGYGTLDDASSLFASIDGLHELPTILDIFEESL